jgi:hypothetical protein
LTCSIGTRFHWEMAWGATLHKSASALTLPAFWIAKVIGLGLMAHMKDILTGWPQAFLSETAHFHSLRMKG